MCVPTTHNKWMDGPHLKHEPRFCLSETCFLSSSYCKAQHIPYKYAYTKTLCSYAWHPWKREGRHDKEKGGIKGPILHSSAAEATSVLRSHKGGNFPSTHVADTKLCIAPHFASKTAMILQGMNSTKHLKVCCGIWRQDISKRSFKSCKLQGVASMDQTCLSCTSHRGSIRLRSEEFGGQVNTHCCAPQTIPERSFCFSARHIVLLKEPRAICSVR